MKKLHILLIVLTSAILAAALAFGLIHLYAAKTTVPSHVKVGGISIGGLTFSEAKVKLQQEMNKLAQAPLTLSIQASGKYPPAQINTTWAKAGVQYTAKTWEAAAAKLQQGTFLSRAAARWHMDESWNLDVSLKPSIIEQQVLTPAWELRQFGKALNARRIISAEDKISYAAGKSVTRVDFPKLVQKLQQAVPVTAEQRSDAMIEVPLRTALPAVTLDALRNQGITRKITEFTTRLTGSQEGRFYNVNAAARVIDGMLLAPGDVFDYSKVIDQAESRYGFKPAPVIVQGRLTPGVGGGICQVSSTLYNAAIRAGLGIVERRNHSLPVSYLPMGQDATFAKGYINFRFKNTTDHYILITSSIDEGHLTVKLFGDIAQNISYKLASRQVEVLPIPEKLVKNTALAPGSREVVQAGREGYIVETYRTKYVNGSAVETRKISRDVYPSRASIIAVNVPLQPESSGGSSSKEQPVEDGVEGPGGVR